MDDDLRTMLSRHMDDTKKDRETWMKHMAEARSARAAHDKSINCLKDNFVEFKDKYGPMLESAVSRKKWWSDRIEDTQKKTVLAVAWGCVIGASYGLILVGKKFLAILGAVQ